MNQLSTACKVEPPLMPQGFWQPIESESCHCNSKTTLLNLSNSQESLCHWYILAGKAVCLVANLMSWETWWPICFMQFQIPPEVELYSSQKTSFMLWDRAVRAARTYFIDERCIGSRAERHFVLDAAVADQATHLLHSLDDVIVRILFAGIQAIILLHLPAIHKAPHLMFWLQETFTSFLHNTISTVVQSSTYT